MRTANEILQSNIGLIPTAMMNEGQRKSICEAINEARKEAIEECAKRAKVEFPITFDHEIDKESILSLIDDLK